MAKSKGTRLVITLECTECRHNERNVLPGFRYTTKKNRKNTPERIELKKFCPHCNHILFIKKLNNLSKKTNGIHIKQKDVFTNQIRSNY